EGGRLRPDPSGNLSRCTGYVGMVRAIRRVLDERRAGALAASALAPRGLGPVGSRHAGAVTGVASAPLAAAIGGDTPLAFGEGDLGLAGKKTNNENRQTFVIPRPPPGAWKFFSPAA